jgi:hypothetical protein
MSRAGTPLRLVDVVETGAGAPSRWAARTTDDRPVDVRYRNGELTVRIGEVGGSIESAKSAPDWFDDAFGKPFDSCATWEEVAQWANLQAT